jgi:hypothetical protein
MKKILQVIIQCRLISGRLAHICNACFDKPHSLSRYLSGSASARNKINFLTKRHWIAICLQVFIFALYNSSIVAQNSVLYNYKNVQIVGGGFVDGIIFHPTAKGVMYCRTDMGGAYRWNENYKRWEPMLDWVSYEDNNLMGIESIALDPSDPDKVYLSCGTYTFAGIPNGEVLRSNDRGKTFQRTNVPFKMGGNEDGRGNGERMAVDPNNGNILYLGTRHAGLWKSTDGAVTWNKVESFPDVTEVIPDNQAGAPNPWMRGNRGSGIVFVLFDPSSGKKNTESKTIYVGVSLLKRENFYRSTDGGLTWNPVAGQPVQYRPNHGILASDGNIFISYGSNPGPSRMTDGGVWKFDTKTNVWTDITPDKPSPEQGKAFGYAAVAIDINNPKTIITSTFGRDEIFRSTNGGLTWKPVFASGKVFDYSLAPYAAHTPVHWMFDIEIDPLNPAHAMFTTGYGGHETFNLTDIDAGKPVKWNIMSTGIEETVALELLSPPKGGQIITAIGDYCGFVHYNLDKPVEDGCFDNPHFGNTNGIACAEKKPEIIVRVGVKSHHKPGTNIGYSLDGGKKWQSTFSVPKPESRHGYIAVSSDGSSWVWTPERSPAYVTNDMGTTWKQVVGLPDNIRVIADRQDTKTFYAMDLFEGKLFISSDGGANFKASPLNLPDSLPKRNKNRGDNRGGQDRIYATPGYNGDLWIAAYDGLYHSKDIGKAFIKINGVQEMHGFGFGKAAPNYEYPTLYMIGVVKGVRGIFRSDNAGMDWVKINDDQHQWGLLLHITGDPKLYGRVYIGTHGRGVIYGDPVK